jgi:Skp family chaperone for outer membrane proteins
MPDAFRLVRLISTAAIVAALATSTGFAQAADAFRIGAINLSYVARSSKIGQSELARIDEAGRKKVTEIETRAAELQRQQVELQKTGTAMSARALADLQRAFDKSRLELERLQQDAQLEIEAMQSRFDAEFRLKLAPIIDEVSKEKGLHFVFGLEQAAIVWWSPAVDISEEVVRRLDAGK